MGFIVVSSSSILDFEQKNSFDISEVISSQEYLDFDSLSSVNNDDQKLTDFKAKTEKVLDGLLKTYDLQSEHFTFARNIITTVMNNENQGISFLQEAISSYDASPAEGEWMESIKKYSNNEVDILTTLSGYMEQYFTKSDETNAAYQEL